MKNIFKKLTGYVLTQYLLFILFPIFSPIQAQTNLSHTSRLNIPITYHTSLVLTKNQELSTKNSIVSDYLSSTKQIIKEDGSIVEQPSYYPYGTFHSYTPGVKEIHTPGVNDNNRYYTGQRKVTNDFPLYNYNARYYNPNLGIFIQPDSVEGPNRYAYVGGNPIMKNDPSGNMSTDTAGSPDQRNILQKAFEMITGADQYPVYANNPKNITQQLQQSLARVDAATGLVSVGSYLEYGARTGGSATGLGGLLLKAIMSYQQIDFNDGIIASRVNFGKQYISRDENTGLFLAGAVMPGANEWKLERISQIPPGQMRLFRGVKSAALQTE